MTNLDLDLPLNRSARNPKRVQSFSPGLSAVAERRRATLGYPSKISNPVAVASLPHNSLVVVSFYFLMAVAMLFTGCSKSGQPSNDTSQNPEPAAQTTTSNSDMVAGRQPTVFAPTPVLQPILTTWQEGHTSAAVDQFIQANWNARPIFPPGMAVGLTDAQFKAIPEADRQLRSNEMEAQLDLMKQLATAVGAAANQAVSKGDKSRARQCYNALTQFGAALDDPKAQQLVQMVGQISRRMGEHGLARLKP